MSTPMHLLCKEAPVLTIAKCRDLDYYEREVIDGREDYLSEGGSSPGRWVGRLAVDIESGRRHGLGFPTTLRSPPEPRLFGSLGAAPVEARREPGFSLEDERAGLTCVVLRPPDLEATGAFAGGGR